MPATATLKTLVTPATGLQDEGTVTATTANGRLAMNGADLLPVADAEVVPGVPMLFQVAIADASADTDLVTTYAIRVVDFWIRSTGIAAHAASDTITLKNGTNAISDVIAKTATVAKVVHASTLAAAYVDVAAGGTLKITAAKNTNVACVAYIMAVRT